MNTKFIRIVAVPAMVSLSEQIRPALFIIKCVFAFMQLSGHCFSFIFALRRIAPGDICTPNRKLNEKHVEFLHYQHGSLPRPCFEEVLLAGTVCYVAGKPKINSFLTITLTGASNHKIASQPTAAALVSRAHCLRQVNDLCGIKYLQVEATAAVSN